MNENGIIDLFFARQESAIAESQKSFGSYCKSIAIRILYNEEDAEECVNDTWLKAWNSIPPNRPEKLAIYMGTITRNLALDRWKQKNTLKRGQGEMSCAIEEMEEILPDRFSVEDLIVSKELEAGMNAFLKTLKERDCNIFLRRYYYMEDYQAIADRYGMKLNTVKTSLFRTRNGLKEYLEKEGLL